ncbi:MAG: hypothetical protein LBP26_02160 [Clostridiales bacterium]|jgi:hypothetical protein|nr:hypothetical protein [Clostridiales bacterium]
MKKRKVLLSVIAVVLSVVAAAGCAGTLTKHGKKYDAVYGVYDNFTVVAQKGGAVLLNGNKKVNKTPYYSIEPVSNTDDIYTFFKVRESVSSGLSLLSAGGALTSVSGKTLTAITPVTVTNEDDRGLERVTITGFTATDSDGKYYLFKPDGTPFPDAYASVSVGDRFRAAQKFEADSDDDGKIKSKWYLFKADGGKLAEKFADVNPYAVSGLLVPAPLAESDANGNTHALYFPDGTAVNAFGGLSSSVGGGWFKYTVKTAADKSESYIVNDGYTPVKLPETYSDEFADEDDDKIYAIETNAEGKKRIKELTGDFATGFYDSINKVSQNGIETCYVAKKDGKNTVFSKKVEPLLEDISAESFGMSSLKYNDDGSPILMATDIVAKKIYANVSGVKRDFTLGANESVGDYDNLGYVEITNSSDATKNRLWIPYTGAVVENFTSVSFTILYAGSYFKRVVAGGGDTQKTYLCAAENLRFWDGSFNTADPNSASFNLLSLFDGTDAVTTDTPTMASPSNVTVSGTIAKGEYQTVEDVEKAKAARSAVVMRSAVTLKNANNVAIVKHFAVYTAGGGAYPSKYITSKNGSSLQASGALLSIGNDDADGSVDIYRLDGEGANQTLKPVMTNVKNAELKSDEYGNDYILLNVGGKKAVYNSDGAQILEPKYNVAYIQNGIATVQNGQFYGVVRLGKKSKLLKKFDYDSAGLLADGSFALTKNGGRYTVYSAKGKTIAKNVAFVKDATVSKNYQFDSYFADKKYTELYAVFGYENGKQQVFALTRNEKDLGCSLASFLD